MVKFSAPPIETFSILYNKRIYQALTVILFQDIIFHTWWKLYGMRPSTVGYSYRNQYVVRAVSNVKRFYYNIC